MNFLEAIKHIKNKLIDAGFESLSNDITEVQLSGGTGGEVLISVCSKLLEIENTNKSAFNNIENESRQLIEYSKSLGLYPMWYGKTK